MDKFKLIFFLLIGAVIISCGSDTPPTSPANPPKSMVKTAAKLEPPVSKSDAPKEVESTVPAPPPPVPVPPEQLQKAQEIIAAVSDAAVSKVDGKKTFRNYCATCHGFNGDLAYNGTKALTKSTYNLEENVAVTYYGRGAMTPYRNLLKPEELVALAKYVEEVIRKK